MKLEFKPEDFTHDHTIPNLSMISPHLAAKIANARLAEMLKDAQIVARGHSGHWEERESRENVCKHEHYTAKLVEIEEIECGKNLD